MTKVRNFRDLRVWQEAFQLTLEIYLISSKFPSKEQFGLTIARGSTHETQHHLLLAEALGYVNTEKAREILPRLSGLNAGINALLKKLPHN